MKPLTLTVFEKHAEPEPPTYRVGGSFTPYAIVAVDKRFTGAELAAEYWMWQGNQEGWLAHPNSDRRSKVVARVIYRASVMARFATLPHHDEEQS